jgi:hypothetical protein
VENYDALKRQHTNAQNSLPKAQRSPFFPPLTQIAEKAGFVVLKDNKVVIFYSNDLAATPSQPVMDATSEEAVRAVNGLCTIQRWTGTVRR